MSKTEYISLAPVVPLPLPWSFPEALHHPTFRPTLFPVSFSNEWPILSHASDFSDIFQTSSIWPQCAMYPRPDISSTALVQSWTSPGTSSPAQLSAICRSLCSSCWVALGRTHVAAADLGLYSQEAPEPAYPVYTFRPWQSTTQPPAQATLSRGRLSGHQSPTEVSPAAWGGPLHG